MATVSIDGEASTVDLYRPTTSFAAFSYVASALTDGLHRIVVEVRGDRNRASSGVEVTIDAFDVT